MPYKGLVFIPDISGFTRFVNETEIDHSRIIIQELLELLINANQIGLEVSEVEGDAILFYKFGEPPAMETLYGQVEKMFCEFHRSLVVYDNRKYCLCKACTSAIGLTLKVITHYGEFTEYNVKNFNKLIGKDIIVAHQLLKNDIENHEYWLVTKNLSMDKAPIALKQWMNWDRSVKQTENGEVSFHYTQLSQLRNEISAEPFTPPDLSRKSKMISVSKEYDTDIISLFHAAGDYNFRARWIPGVKKVEELNHFLPRVGMRWHCIFDNGEIITYTSSYYFNNQNDRIEFIETNEKDKSLTHYILEQIEENKIKLTLEYLVEKNLASQIKFKLTKKKKIEEAFYKSLENLTELVKEVNIPALI